jgi:hypothetical protein
VLAGDSARAAEEITAQAGSAGLGASRRAGADACARYLSARHEYLRYDQALANGWPIATGVIEGACRHLIADRLDIGGARWGLDGAEAVLTLRAVISNGDFEEYWRFHLARGICQQARKKAQPPPPPGGSARSVDDRKDRYAVRWPGGRCDRRSCLILSMRTRGSKVHAGHPGWSAG